MKNGKMEKLTRKRKDADKREKREILALRNYYFSPECVMDSKLS